MESIKEIHQQLISKSRFFKAIEADIRDDGLMHKITLENNKIKIKKQSYTEDTNELIKDWYNMASDLYLTLENTNIIFYRGFGIINNLQYIIQPIPFSTTYDKDKSSEYGTGNILEIHVPSKTRFTYINDAEKEVILPAGIIIILKKYQEPYISENGEDYNVFKCTFEPTQSYADMKELWSRYDITSN